MLLFLNISEFACDQILSQNVINFNSFILTSGNYKYTSRNVKQVKYCI